MLESYLTCDILSVFGNYLLDGIGISAEPTIEQVRHSMPLLFMDKVARWYRAMGNMG